MRAVTLTAVLGLVASAACVNIGHRNVHGHGHLHARHGHLHARDYDATVVETVTDVVTAYVYPDGESAPAPTSSVSSTSSSSSSSSFSTSTTVVIPGGAFQEKVSSSSSVSTSSVSIPPPAPTTLTPVPSTTTPPPAPTTTTAPVVVAPKPSTTAAPAPASNDWPLQPNERAITIVNWHTNAILTAHDDTTGTPTSAGKPVSTGTIPAGATVTFAVPSGWIGNVALNDAQFAISPDSTLLEANYGHWADAQRLDIDVSFVNGFTLPAVCSCGGVVTTGCNIDLLSLFTCPLGLTAHGACPNPLRASEAATKATSFFQPCQGAAWTFVNDGNADSNCVTGNIECCVGTACPANPKQS